MLDRDNFKPLLKTLRKRTIPYTLICQTPGTTMFSPHSTGSCHFVITYGKLVEQLAINDQFTAEGTKQCVKFWKKFSPVASNSGLATKHITIVHWLQQKYPDLDFGVGDEVALFDRWATAAISPKVRKITVERRDYDNKHEEGSLYCVNQKCPVTV